NRARGAPGDLPTRPLHRLPPLGAAVRDESPHKLPIVGDENEKGPLRREMLQLLGAGLALAACEPSRGQILPYVRQPREVVPGKAQRSEEHTSELQSRENLVCRLLLEK